MIRTKQSVIASPHYFLALLVLVFTGCGFNSPPRGPDVAYSRSSTEAKQLQVPPDLTNISNGEQFVLPGVEPGPLARNRLLPVINDAQYIRSGGQNWLQFSQSAETIWPIVLAFVSKEKWVVEKTAPTTGLVLTQWRSDSTGAGGLLSNLISSDELFSRVAFRLERSSEGTRVFARSMQLSGDAIEGGAGETWPESSHDPEAVSDVLAKLLVFFGVEAQKAQGILSDSQANAVLDDSHLQTTAAGSQIVINKAFSPSFDDVKAAIDELPYTVTLSDGSVGTIEIASTADAEPVLVSVTPLHISAVRVQVSKATGVRLEKDQELSLLNEIHGQLQWQDQGQTS